MTTFNRNCRTCAFGTRPATVAPCNSCSVLLQGESSNWAAPIGHNGGPPFDCRPHGCGPCTCEDGLCGKRGEVEPKPDANSCGGFKCQAATCTDCYPRNPPPIGVPPADIRGVHLPEDEAERNQMLLFEGFMAYFPNAMAEVAKLSYAATKQHHPDKPMHWDRSKSTDHLNKIARHMVDHGKLDNRGQRHSASLAWRAMANLQEELERELGLPPSPASRNRPF